MMRKIIKTPLKIDTSFNDKFYNQNSVVQQRHTIPLVIDRYYTDVNGTILDKNDASIPASLKVKFPIYLLSQFDRAGGFKKSLQIVPPLQNTFYLQTFIWGVNTPFLSFTGLNNIRVQLKIGDVVMIYTDDIANPNFFVWFVLTCDSVSYASIVQNVETTQNDKRLGVLYLKEINYYVTARAQFEQAIIISAFDNIGNYRSDAIQPSIFLSPFVDQIGFLTLTTEYKIDQYIGMSTYFIFEVDKIQMDLIVNKI